MRGKVPALAPLFRSEHQLRLLAELFAGREGEATIAALSERTGIPLSTVSREVARLARHGIVRTRTEGRNRLVSAEWSLPWAPALRTLLVQTVGAVGLLAEALTPVHDIDAAYVFGSWAARYHGAAGSFPRDLDVLVIGAPDRRELAAACRAVEAAVAVEVTPVVAAPADWANPPTGSFLAEVQRSPMVEVVLTPAVHDRAADAEA